MQSAAVRTEAAALCPAGIAARLNSYTSVSYTHLHREQVHEHAGLIDQHDLHGHDCTRFLFRVRKNGVLILIIDAARDAGQLHGLRGIGGLAGFQMCIRDRFKPTAPSIFPQNADSTPCPPLSCCGAGVLCCAFIRLPRGCAGGFPHPPGRNRTAGSPPA